MVPGRVGRAALPAEQKRIRAWRQRTTRNSRLGSGEPAWLIFSMKLTLLRSLLVIAAPAVFAADANRLAYLEDASPFWPTASSPKLITPQWVGESGIEAVVILAIDDMRGAENAGAAKYETFLRPILDRLKQIDGRAPVSIMTCNVASDDPQLQTWLREGLSLEVHTLTHPCPCLGKVPFGEAARVYHGGVDLLATILTPAVLLYYNHVLW